MNTTDVSDGRALLPITPDTLAIMAFPDGRPSGRGLSRGPSAPLGTGEGVLQKLDRIARFKRNPRDPEYMRHVAASLLPHARVMEVDRAVPAPAIAQAPHIVLLWPDAIGYAWFPLEREVFRHKRRDAVVYAVNGRRRAFRLTPLTLLGLRLRRLAERLWLGEAVMAVGLLVSAPFLVMWDFARGHR